MAALGPDLEANRSLPAELRKNLRRYDLAAVLAGDPTEAIHSSRIPETVGRYFEICERHDAGGGLAYELLTHNPQVDQVPPEELEPHVARLLERDRRATRRGRVPPMFSYFICRPRKAVLEDEERLSAWQREEDDREEWARRHRGVYSATEYVDLCAQLAWARVGDQSRRLRMAVRLRTRVRRLLRRWRKAG